MLLPVVAWTAPLPPTQTSDLGFHFRLGFDSNPVGTSDAITAPGAARGSITRAAGTGFSARFAGHSPEESSLMLGYQGEWISLERWPGENFSTHRFTAGVKLARGDWKLAAEGSSLYVAGSADTLPSLASANANATALWRERHRQWQHRLRLQAQTETGPRLLRATATLLAYDYRTRVVPGKVAFADRSDTQVGFDAGWKPRASSLWLAGLRAGRQDQAIVPLPNCGFDYSNEYGRLVLGWEGKLPAGTSVSFAAGPDFRRYTGAVDPTTFRGGRDRTSFWFEASFTARPHPSWTLSGKATRASWLPSTGKSAYCDSSAEAVATWSPRADWTVRFSGKIHRSDYFPAARDDWEWILGAGVSRTLSPRIQLALDLQRQRAWNGLSASPGREFHRVLVQVGTTVKL